MKHALKPFVVKVAAAADFDLAVFAWYDGDFDNAVLNVLRRYVGEGYEVAFLPKVLGDFPGDGV